MNQINLSLQPLLKISDSLVSARVKIKRVLGKPRFETAIENDALASQKANFGANPRTPRGQFETICYTWTRHMYPVAKDISRNINKTTVVNWCRFRELLKTRLEQPLQDIFTRDDIGSYHAKDAQLFNNLEIYFDAIRTILECVEREIHNATILENYENKIQAAWRENQELKNKFALSSMVNGGIMCTQSSSKNFTRIPNPAATRVQGDTISRGRMPLPSARTARAASTGLTIVSSNTPVSLVTPNIAFQRR